MAKNTRIFAVCRKLSTIGCELRRGLQMVVWGIGPRLNACIDKNQPSNHKEASRTAECHQHPLKSNQIYIVGRISSRRRDEARRLVRIADFGYWKLYLI